MVGLPYLVSAAIQPNTKEGGTSMHQLKCACLITTVVLIAAALSPACATPIIVPVGLQPGDHYRLAFVTVGTTNALSDVISTYNSFVSAEAMNVPELAAL